MRAVAAGVRVAYYGDDFTGATDTLATAATAGLRTMLFLGLPTAARISHAGELDCVGIAGAARSMTPNEMRRELEQVGTLFAQLDAPVMHYKVCSTFDSSAQIGSIGAAIRILRRHAANPLVCIVGGQPNLRRYCVFGNLFAAAGGAGPLYRIDRHPTMSQHPVTPMSEADLALHLAQQGLERIASIQYTEYDGGFDALEAKLDLLLAQQPDAILFDVSDAGQLALLGRVIWTRAQREHLLAAGPSTVIQALAAHWRSGVDGIGDEVPVLQTVRAASGPVFALSGSLSPVTARQIEAAHSYVRLPIDPNGLVEADGVYCMSLASDVKALLRSGSNVLAFISRTDAATGDERPDSRALAAACGKLLAAVLTETLVRRVGIAGGDTSSHAVQALDAWGLSYAGQLAAGVALCRMHSDDPGLDGLEIMLKGGQMGPECVFGDLLHGS